MASTFSHRLETFVGVGLLLVSILGFILLFVLNLPRDKDVQSQAQILKPLPHEIFDGNNVVNQEINKLRVPGGVPVRVDSNNLGRPNVFSNF